MGIGKRIKEARDKKGLTQKDLGLLIGVTGSAITNYENEVSHPKELVLYRLMEALDVDANFLFQDVVGNKKMPPAEAEGIKSEVLAMLSDMDPEDVKHLVAFAEFLLSRRKAPTK